MDSRLKMRNIHGFIAVLVLIFLSFSGWSQTKNKNVAYADKFFKIKDYYLATEYYEKALAGGEDTDYVHYQLGECDRRFYQYEEAEKHYKSVVDKATGEYPLATYYYALMLKNNGKFKMSVIEFNSFLNQYKSDDKFRLSAQLEKEGSLYVIDELSKTLREYNFHNLGNRVNTKESDFAPTIFDHDSSIVISSARFNKKHEEVYGRLGGAFLDNYTYLKTSDSTWSKNRSMSNFNELNTPYHEGAGTFSNEKSAFYFTRCDEKGTNKHEYHCAVYVSENKNGEWQTAQKLNKNINPKDSWNAHPSLSTTGDTLFFASKREGGLGSTDIWYSINEGDDLAKTWGEAINIGSPINTKYIDMSPQYVRDKEVLVFSSNGHVGFGGLDVYVASGDRLTDVRNLGLPFNSNHDDFHMVIGDSLGYVSSNRSGGYGSDDVYSFNNYSTSAHIASLEKSTDKRYDHVDMYGKISTRGKSSLEGVDILVKNQAGRKMKSTKTDANGEFLLNDIDLQDDKQVVIDLPAVHLLSEDNYVVDSLSFTIKSSIVNVSSKDTSSVDIAGVVLDENGNPVSGAKVTLLDLEGNELMYTLTNEDGEFIFRSLDGSKEYTVRVDEGYTISNIQIDKNKDEINTKSISDANEGLASRIKAESIYFDFNSTVIRKEAENTLVDIKKVLDEYPNVTLELHGYTDDKGSSSYNILLGENRGNSALKVLVDEGIDVSRIQVKTHGESEPVASNKTFEGRQLNRRVDFYILGGAKYKKKAQVYIMKPGTTLNDVASAHNMTLAELKELNNLDSNTELKNYAPLRVKASEERDEVSSEIVGMESSQVEELKELVTKEKESNYIIKNDSYHNDVKYLKSASDGYYLVLPKNTLFTISQITKTSVKKIKSLNKLKDTHLLAGQVLQLIDNPSVSKREYLEGHRSLLTDLGIAVSQHEGEVFILDGYSRYVVKNGDTLNGISSKFGVTSEEIKSLNNLKSDELQKKMVLKLKKAK